MDTLTKFPQIILSAKNFWATDTCQSTLQKSWFLLSLGLKLQFLSLQRKQSMCVGEGGAKDPELLYVKIYWGTNERVNKASNTQESLPFILAKEQKQIKNFKPSNYTMYIFIFFSFFFFGDGFTT